MRALVCLLTIIFLAPTAGAFDEAAFDAKVDAAMEAMASETRTPVSLRVTTQTATAKGRIGFSGGTLTLDGQDATYVLEIPPDALIVPAEIEMTSLAAVEGLGDGVTSVLGVKLAPAGLTLMVPGTLTITPKAGPVEGRFFPFSFRGEGEKAAYAEWIPPDRASLTVQVRHFSGFGIARGTVATLTLNQAQTETDSEGIGSAVRNAWTTANNEIAGGAGTGTSGDTPEEAIQKAIDRRRERERSIAAKRPFTVPESPACDSVSKTIDGLNAETATKDQDAAKRKADKPKKSAFKILPQQWQRYVQCAQPEVEKCFANGDPKELLKLYKRVKLYRPDPNDAIDMRNWLGVKDWIDENIRKCARYDLTVDSSTSIEGPKSMVTWLGEINFSYDVRLNPDTETYTVKGAVKILNLRIDCKVRGAKCIGDGMKVTVNPELTLDLAELPFLLDGRPEASQFNPGIGVGFVELYAKISAQGIAQRNPFEVVFSMWSCHFKKEYDAKSSKFRFAPEWKPGEYPVFFRLDRNSPGKKCPNLPDATTNAKAKGSLTHKPEGSPSPPPVIMSDSGSPLAPE